MPTGFMPPEGVAQQEMINFQMPTTMNNFYPAPQMFPQVPPGIDFFRPGSAVVNHSRAQKGG